MNNQQAGQWLEQEMLKIRTVDQASAHLAAYERSKAFFNSPAGVASAKKDPIARQVRHDLAAFVKAKFNL